MTNLPPQPDAIGILHGHAALVAHYRQGLQLYRYTNRERTKSMTITSYEAHNLINRDPTIVWVDCDEPA